MILNICCYKNKAIKSFTTPFAVNIPVDNLATEVSRAVVLNNNNEQHTLKHCALYHIGSFDDQTGLIVPIEPDFLVDVDDIVGGVDHGIKED